MSYHSDLHAEQSTSDDAIAAAERRGAREALTRLAAEFRGVGHDLWAQRLEESRDREYPAPRVRAVVRDGLWKYELHGKHWQQHSTPRTSYRAITCAAVAQMHTMQQRADAEGLVSEDDAVGLAETPRSPSRQSDPASSAPTPAPRERIWLTNRFGATWEVTCKDAAEWDRMHPEGAPHRVAVFRNEQEAGDATR